RWVFWYNVPFGLLCLAWGAAVLRPAEPARGERGVDVPGNVLILTGLGGLLFGLSQAGDLGWTSPLVLSGIGAFAALLPLFITVVLLMALFFQAVQADDAVTAGLKVLAMPAIAVIASTGSGFLQRGIDPRTIAALASALTTLGLLVLLVAVSPHTGYWPIMLGLMLMGAGSGAFLPANATALLRALPSHRLGIVNAMRLMIMNIGIVISTALAFPIITAPVPAPLRDHVFAGTLSQISTSGVAQLVTGYRYALALMATLSALAMLSCYAARRSDKATRSAAVPQCETP
ncbi:MFS transporter, partial [Actinomadura sp. NPDC048394]|uniref:MFS transporter n=1 Tax=Actinomadura sp. NPDC048394 TaxID=3158223 RepID=UPI0033C1F0BC